MELKNLIFIGVFLIAFGFFFYSIRRILKYILLGQKENRFDKPLLRIKNVIKIAFGQSKILRDRIAGPIHFLIFWGFLLFLFAVLESIIQGFYSSFNLEFLGIFFSLITFTQDYFGLFIIIAVVVAVLRRFFFKVDRLKVGIKGSIDAAFILVMILGVVLSMYGQNVASLVQRNLILHEGELRPVSLFLASNFFINVSVDFHFLYEVFWWIHILLIFSFMNFLPYSKHFHVLSSIPNVYFSKIGLKKFTLNKIDLEDENISQYGTSDFEHLSWKQLLDGFSCTECGRCSEVCPAANSGKKLSPRKIIVDIRKRTEEKAPLLLSNKQNEELISKTIVHNYVTDDELWACTTCGACVYECPVTIEHIDSIVDMRRNLVLMESSFPNELNAVFKNLETNFTPWSFNAQDRANWAEGMNIKTLSEEQNCEYLFWVGCAGSFDARYQKVTKAIAKLLQIANIEFRILGIEEKCNGDTARRLGNEYLAQMMMQENVETLNKYQVKKIVTGCPHCYNSLKNEYPQFGGNFEIFHHTELFEKLIKEKRILFSNNEMNLKMTYHDSCYLGRYNDIYESPRNVINGISGIELVEMERNKDKGFCCGAGGGRMFLEEIEGRRINEIRTEEALNTKSNTIASACPFCMTMLLDGVKAFEKTEEVAVKDIAEILLDNTINH
jgi:Fe-S oxidoreductase